MTIATEGIRSNLQAFAFEDLFREELGWDTYKQTLSVAVGDTAYGITPI